MTARVHGRFVLSSSNIALSGTDCSCPLSARSGGSRGDGPLRPRGPRATGLMTCVRRHCTAQRAFHRPERLPCALVCLPKSPWSCLRCSPCARCHGGCETETEQQPWPAHGGHFKRRARGPPECSSGQLCSRAEWQQRGSSVRTISLGWWHCGGADSTTVNVAAPPLTALIRPLNRCSLCPAQLTANHPHALSKRVTQWRRAASAGLS